MKTLWMMSSMEPCIGCVREASHDFEETAAGDDNNECSGRKFQRHVNPAPYDSSDL